MTLVKMWFIADINKQGVWVYILGEKLILEWFLDFSAICVLIKFDAFILCYNIRNQFFNNLVCAQAWTVTQV